METDAQKVLAELYQPTEVAQTEALTILEKVELVLANEAMLTKQEKDTARHVHRAATVETPHVAAATVAVLCAVVEVMVEAPVEAAVTVEAPHAAAVIVEAPHVEVATVAVRCVAVEAIAAAAHEAVDLAEEVLAEVVSVAALMVEAHMAEAMQAAEADVNFDN